jgi:hypothetical protein
MVRVDVLFVIMVCEEKKAEKRWLKQYTIVLRTNGAVVLVNTILCK